MNERIVEWANQQFGIKLQPRDVDSLLKGRNGERYSKMFGVFVEQVVSKSVGEKMSAACKIYDESISLNKLESRLRLTDKKMVDQADPIRHDFVDTQNYLSTLLTTLEGIKKRFSSKDTKSECIEKLKGAIKSLEPFDLRSDQATSTNERHHDWTMDDIVVEIDNEIQEINAILFELDQLSSNQGSDNLTLNSESLEMIARHQCRTKIVCHSDSAEPVFDMEIAVVGEYERLRKASQIKLLDKLKKAKSLLREAAERR
ncbi:hypothetical protein HDE_11668 [Halotydeus destructor]|nr:hypothetical protein HDE_11668 [Halotydeus destructor]